MSATGARRVGAAVTVVVVGALLLDLTRGTTFWYDDWLWIADRREPSADSLLRPHNQHLSLVPVLLYQALFALAGLDHHLPWRLLLIGTHLTVGALVFVYARRRVGDAVAGGLAVLLLLLGPAWQSILWPFMVTQTLSIIGGIGALLALDRRDRRGDVTASVLLGLALASSSFAIPLVVGVAVDLLWTRRTWRSAWIVAVPVALYAVWWLAYQEPSTRLFIGAVPQFVADSLAATVAALAGLGRGEEVPSGEALEWGRPLAVVAVVLVGLRLRALRPVPGRVMGLLAVLLSFWVLTGATRILAPPETSRYLYAAATFAVLVGVELARGLRLPGGTRWMAAAALVFAVTSNVVILHRSADFVRSDAGETRAALGAAQLSAGHLPPDAPLTELPGYPLVAVPAAAYLEAAREDGPVGASPAQLAASPEPQRLKADAQLRSFAQVALSPPGTAAAGPAPRIDGAMSGTVGSSTSCARLEPAAAAVPDARATLDVTVPPAGVLLRAGDQDLEVALRRFAAGYGPPFARLRAHGAAVLRLPQDAAPQLWHVRVASDGPIRVCGLA